MRDESNPSAPAPATQAATPLVILNPASDRGRAARLRLPIERALAGGRGELIQSSGPREAERLAASAASAGRDVIAVGGDGTVSEVANGILSAGAGASVAFGVVPAGNGNDYAYETLHLPRDPLRALEVALTGEALAMDVGLVNGRYFVNSLGVGLDANIAAAAEEMKRFPFMRGQTLYWASSLRELLLHYDRCPRLSVVCDGVSREHQQFAVAAVSLGPTYGGGFRINPNADPRDGFFDLCTIWKPPLLRALRLLPMVERGQHLAEPEVSHSRVRQVILESGSPVFAHLDGEVVRESRFEARIMPGALRVRQSPAI